MNAWEDETFRKAVEATGRRKLVLAGWWTEVCAAYPTLSALKAGYDVYVPTDACGDISVEAHERAVQRIVQAGAVPMTTFQTLFEWQRDWGRMGTYDGVMTILKEHSDYGMVVIYAKSMFGEHGGESKAA